jgi:hypothetical protein
MYKPLIFLIKLLSTGFVWEIGVTESESIGVKDLSCVFVLFVVFFFLNSIKSEVLGWLSG